jgi:hypothetical protein
MSGVSPFFWGRPRRALRRLAVIGFAPQQAARHFHQLMNI